MAFGQRLYLRIWLAVVAAVTVLTLVVGWLWQQALERDRAEREARFTRTILVENAVTLWLEPVNGIRGLAKYGLHRAADAVTNSCVRQLPLVIAETDELKAMMVAHRGIPPDRIRVIGLGLDHRGADGAHDDLLGR